VTVIDFHTHAFADAVAEKAMEKLVDESGYVPSHNGTLGGLRGALEKAGVSEALVLSIATRPKHVSVINDWAIAREAEEVSFGHQEDKSEALSASPSRPRLRFFGTLHPGFSEYEREAIRLREAGIRGIKLHPNYQEFLPDDPALLPMFRVIAREKMIVLIHAGYDIAFPDAPGSPDRLARLNDAVPDLLLVCAHFGGWRQWDEVERDLLGRENVYLDTSFTLGDLPDDRFLALARRHGIDRIVFGTDSPWRDQGEDLDHFARLSLTPEEREAIYWRNAARLLADGAE